MGGALGFRLSFSLARRKVAEGQSRPRKTGEGRLEGEPDP